jgi:hypothetical protein
MLYRWLDLNRNQSTTPLASLSVKPILIINSDPQAFSRRFLGILRVVNLGRLRTLPIVRLLRIPGFLILWFAKTDQRKFLV